MSLKNKNMPSPSEVAEQASKQAAGQQISQKTKFATEDLEKLKALQNKTTNVVNAFGQLKLSEIRLENQSSYLKEQLNILQKEEADLAKTLSEKYGKGTLDAETGEFTPSE
mgnify:CR=1 FL=1